MKDLQAFLGLVNFYHRFLPTAAKVLAPLYDLTKSRGQSSSRNRPLPEWTPDHDRAFSEAKNLLASATLLSYPSMSAPLALTTDASSIAVGAVMEQFKDGQWQPLAFFSKRLRPAETRYAAFDRELLAVYLAVKHFRFFL